MVVAVWLIRNIDAVLIIKLHANVVTNASSGQIIAVVVIEQMALYAFLYGVAVASVDCLQTINDQAAIIFFKLIVRHDHVQTSAVVQSRRVRQSADGPRDYGLAVCGVVVDSKKFYEFGANSLAQLVLECYQLLDVVHVHSKCLNRFKR